jgi:hypothetical protein
LEDGLIPDFDDNGYLPPGIHRATLDEIEVRFGMMSEVRQVQLQSLRWLMELVSEASVARIVLNGSWVTNEPEPIDIDCVLLAGLGWGGNPAVEAQLEDGLPYLTPQIANQRIFDEYTTRIFASDRAEVPKGMIEVIR